MIWFLMVIAGILHAFTLASVLIPNDYYAPRTSPYPRFTIFGQIDLEPCVVVMQWYRNSISGGGYQEVISWSLRDMVL